MVVPPHLKGDEVARNLMKWASHRPDVQGAENTDLANLPDDVKNADRRRKSGNSNASTPTLFNGIISTGERVYNVSRIDFDIFKIGKHY